MKYAILVLLMIPTVSALDITEIMYNPEGSDYNREWIELFGPENLEDYIFYENDINHGITKYHGGENCHIITKDPEQFISEFQTECNIYISSFSLSNSGETISFIGENTAEKSYTDIAEEGMTINYANGKISIMEPNPGIIVENVPEFSMFGILGIISLVYLYYHKSKRN